MKSWTIGELDHILGSLHPLIGLRLQEVITGTREVVLGFYSPEGLLWLWIDLDAIRPSLLPWMRLPLKPQAKKTPVQLFLRAHFVGRVLRDVVRLVDQGRIVLFQFGSESEQLEMEVRLFPHGRNLLLRASGRSLAWEKPKEVVESQAPGHENLPVSQGRSLEQLRTEWLALRGGSTLSRKNKKITLDPKARLENDLNKKKLALAKVQDELRRKKDQPWRAVGDWIKQHQSLEVPREWEPFIDRRRKLAWNIEQCFGKAREIEGKAFGTEKRILILQEEIHKIERQLAGSAADLPAEHGHQSAPSLSKIEAQGRTLKLAEDLTAVMGKSAADNLKILRRARGWDLWFHLRDTPSSHAVLFRNKGTKVSEARILEVATWFVRQQLGPKAAHHVGEKFDLVIAECRHVHPIKGDKIGRVTYRDERVLILRFLG